MKHLSTTDNNRGKTLHSLGCTDETAGEVYADLSAIANTTVQDLCAKNPALLVFPHCLGKHGDDIGKLKTFELSSSLDQPQNATLTTGNLMGFIGCEKAQVSITSRFTESSESSLHKQKSEDFFLHYMLEKVGLVNSFDLLHSFTKANIFDILLFLFPAMLRKAMSQGLFTTYRNFKRNDANLKGTVDVSRHIHHNVPFGGRVAYNSRERTFDNAVTELIRHTIEAIKLKTLGKHLLITNPDTKRDVEKIIQATPSYNYFARDKIIAQNTKPKIQPFFSNYRALQKLCLAILHHQKIAYRQNSNEVYGVLFDGAWLWEEYLAKVLSPCGFKHPQNRVGSGGILVWNGNPRYPDFYTGKQIRGFRLSETIPQENFVLDAKYKRFDTSIARDDVHQLIAYMHILPANRAGLIYPSEQTALDADIAVQHKSYRLYGLGGKLESFGFSIPKLVESNQDSASPYLEFTKRMLKMEKLLIQQLDM